MAIIKQDFGSIGGGGMIKTLRTSGTNCPDNTTTNVTVTGIEKIYQVDLQNNDAAVYDTAYLNTDTDEYVFLNKTSYAKITSISGNVVSVKLTSWGSAMNAKLIVTGV